MEHIIRASFGDSTATYGGKEWSLKPYGSVQGNGLSPMIWVAISTVLFLALNEKKYREIFRAPVTNLLTKLAGFTFFDDTDLLQTQHLPNDTIEEVVEELQGSLETWQGTLNTSCGALDCDDPNKSYWYSIGYEWNA